ncbi:cation-transporting ATPase [Sporocytophaga myxococcoides]|uniref:Cation-transporting ATPase n=1 Tax=Sporocytophaga myxococcoides TaxID=153721 RepID=A0A098LFU9_9BACT|nr:heavy-metal-associated domain-containing protein [Sporocytophaga myxococcoides]GAL85850.1 cation-transporting ATPase [Sporocytophaga myxococcoides]
MKSQIRIFALLFTIMVTVFITNSTAHPLHYETISFKVSGNCEMCKKRIESALKGNAAIKSVDWNVKTKVVKVEYNLHLISLDKIHQLIADAGHDTDKIKANLSIYNKLPDCCQYDRKK